MKNKLINLDKDAQDKMLKALQSYVQKELDLEMGSFQAQFFLDFILEEMAPYFYNQAIHDSQQLLSEKFLYLADDLYLLSKPEKY